MEVGGKEFRQCGEAEKDNKGWTQEGQSREGQSVETHTHTLQVAAALASPVDQSSPYSCTSDTIIHTFHRIPSHKNSSDRKPLIFFFSTNRVVINCVKVSPVVESEARKSAAGLSTRHPRAINQPHGPSKPRNSTRDSHWEPLFLAFRSNRQSVAQL